MPHIYHGLVRGERNVFAQSIVLLLIGLGAILPLFHGDISGGSTVYLVETAFTDQLNRRCALAIAGSLIEIEVDKAATG